MRTTMAMCLILMGLTGAACGATTSTSTAAADGQAADTKDDAGAGDVAAGDGSASDTATGDTASSEVATPDATLEIADGAADASADVPVSDAPTSDAPTSDAPTSDAPTSDVPTSDVPTTDVATALVAGNLVESGWSFGECMKGCKGTMTLQGAALELTIRDNDGTIAHQAKGILTTGAAAQLESLVNPLVGKPLPLVSGCPDCADGGAAYLTFSDGSATSKHTYEFGKPPAALTGLDQLMAVAQAGLKNCQGDATVVVQGVCPISQP